MQRNYFKANGHFFFFVDTVVESIEAAYAAASTLGTVSLYRAVAFAGPWDSADIIGHRPRKEILQDLSLNTDKEELYRLHEELEALHRCYEDIGRPVPLMSVAA